MNRIFIKTFLISIILIPSISLGGSITNASIEFINEEIPILGYIVLGGFSTLMGVVVLFFMNRDDYRSLIGFIFGKIGGLLMTWAGLFILYSRFISGSI